MSGHMEAEKAKLLEAALAHVPFDGWSEATLRHAAADTGLQETDARRAFPRGPIDLVAYYVADADIRMLRELERLDLPSMRIRDRITLAIRTRLEQNQAHREAVGRAVSLLAMPQHGTLAAKSLYRTVDAMWHAAGDTATDFNFYSKRAILAGVYSATLMYWLNDNSENSERTWAFLDRRIADVMRYEKVKGRVSKLRDRLPDPFRLLRRAPGL